MVGDKRVRKSTGIADKATATKVAAAVKELADGILSPSQERLKRLCGAVFDAAGVVPFWEDETAKEWRVSSWLGQWVDQKESGRTNKELISKYRSAFLSFCIFEDGPRLMMRGLKVSHISRWAEHLSMENSPATVKQKVGMLASALDDAVADRVLASNPARKVKLEGGATVEKRELSDTQINQLRDWLLHSNEAHKKEWIVAIDLARWNGLRLMDAVSITPQNIDIKNYILDFVCRKTGERMVVPMHPAVDSIVSMYGTCERLRLKSKSQLSQTFTRILEKAGIENPITVSASGKNLRSLGFHSLRHSFITDLERKGVPEDVRMKLSGHRSRKIHAGYSHTCPIEEAQKICPW
jgi:integrase